MGQSATITCPTCNSGAVNMVANPEVKHSPEGNGWYGQCHTFTIPMQCDACKGDFVVEFGAYKNWAAVDCRVV